MAKCDQILTISTDRLLNQAGHLEEAPLAPVDAALRYSLGLS